jgi:hypothetical protein
VAAHVGLQTSDARVRCKAIRLLFAVFRLLLAVTSRFAAIAVPSPFLIGPGVHLLAGVGDYTGWYRIEDYICTSGTDCRGPP